MDSSNETLSEDAEPHAKQGSESGFFKKFTVLTPQETEPTSESVFKKYVPLRVDGNKNDTEQLIEYDHGLFLVPDAVPLKLPRRSRALAFSVLAALGFIVVTLIAVYVFRTKPSDQQIIGQAPILEEKSKTSDDARPATEPESPLDSKSQEVDEKNENTPIAAGLRGLTNQSSAVIHNIVLARAREFEDRGMLARAEQEYRAAVATFPDDRLIQEGLKRVQNILLEKQQEDASRQSREVGLKAFRMSDFEGASRELAAAVNAGRSDTATLYALGISYGKLGSNAKAEKTLQDCIAGDPNYAPALVGLAQVTAASGRKNEALPLLRRALDLGGGAEFTPTKIKEMISRLFPESSKPADPVPAPIPPDRSQPTFFAHASHVHDLLLSSCRGDLAIVNSVVHFSASTPSHSFHFLLSEISGAYIKNKELRFNANGKAYRFNLNGRSPKDFLEALASEVRIGN